MYKRSITIIPLVVIFLLISAPLVLAEEEHEEEAEKWIISHYESGNLDLTPDHSLPQWSTARMVMVEASEGEEVNIMSIHNETYILILVERDLNTSIDKVGVALGFNMSRTVWAWVGGQEFVVNDHGVKTIASLKDQALTLVFGRQLSLGGSSMEFRVGIPLPDFVSVITWDNGSARNQLSFRDAPTLGLELLPYMDVYPKAPIVYSIVILIAGLGFIFIETRKYREGG